MATLVAARPLVTLATRLDALSDLTGDQAFKASQAGIDTMQDLIDAMCDPVNIRVLVNGDRKIDLALMMYIDDETSDVLEKLALSFSPRPANLATLVPAGTGANPPVTAHGNSTTPQKSLGRRIWDWDWK